MAIQKTLAAPPIGVKTLPTDDLIPNPHNPRHLFDKEPMGVLKESIKRMGILVPLTVYFDERKQCYVILDGQRRWTCAQAIGLPKVPVNQVAEPSLVQNIVTMFQIHKLREDWELMPTALKVELLMDELQDKNDARLGEVTGLDEAVIVRCKKLLSYSKAFQDLMLDPDPDKRMKADFFIELYAVIHDREVRKFDWFSEKTFIRQMIDKYQDESKTIKSVTDFRLVKQHITNAKRTNHIKKLGLRLKKFSEEISVPISHLEIESATIRGEARSITKKLTALETVISEIDTEQFYGEEELWQAMNKLLEILEKKLKQANKRR